MLEFSVKAAWDERKKGISMVREGEGADLLLHAANRLGRERRMLTPGEGFGRRRYG
jgi:hypothetical protein